MCLFKSVLLTYKLSMLNGQLIIVFITKIETFYRSNPNNRQFINILRKIPNIIFQDNFVKTDNIPIFTKS